MTIKFIKDKETIRDSTILYSSFKQDEDQTPKGIKYKILLKISGLLTSNNMDPDEKWESGSKQSSWENLISLLVYLSNLFNPRLAASNKKKQYSSLFIEHIGNAIINWHIFRLDKLLKETIYKQFKPLNRLNLLL